MRIASALTLSCLLSACGPAAMNTPDGGGGDGSQGTTCSAVPYTEDLTGCAHAPSDYEPRQSMSVNDTWPACISDDNTFHLVGMSTPSSAARTLAFEAMAAKLWKNPNLLTLNDFLQARNDYSVPQGVGSRVERRQDIHYPEIPGPNKFACAEMGVPAQFPDRCAGPAKLIPVINDAFEKGLTGVTLRIQAARLEAALLWFSYLSTLSEVWTCSFDKIDDCDSVWGYYDGAQDRSQPLGLGGYIDALGPETHDRAFDGILAERCWRDLDRALPSMNADLYTRAQAQLDKALVRGVALIARDRFGRISCSTGEWQEAHFQFLKLIVGFLDRESQARDPAKAALLKAQLEKPRPADVDVAMAQQLIDTLYPCP